MQVDDPHVEVGRPGVVPVLDGQVGDVRQQGRVVAVLAQQRVEDVAGLFVAAEGARGLRARLGRGCSDGRRVRVTLNWL